LQDSDGDDLKVSLLGLPKESDWILYPSYTDKTFIRNVLAHELWRAMGYYSPRCRYVELFVVTNSSMSNGERVESLNGGGALSERAGRDANIAKERRDGGRDVSLTNGYQGVYVLMEKIKRGKDRVKIKKLDAKDSTEPNITGGYIFKKDRLNPGEHGFKSSQGMEFAYEEPKERDITPVQAQWLTNYLNEFERVFASDGFGNPETGYRKYIDVDSFIDYHWITEVGRNIDGFWFSQFYHKDRGGKLTMGPVWDWDLSFGSAFYREGYKTNGWRWDQIRGPHYGWFGRLFEDPDFLQRYIDRWAELRTNVFATSNVLARVDTLAAELKEAQERNYKRWPTLGKFVHPNRFTGKTYQEEADWLKNWIKARLAWIDSQDFPKPNIQISLKREKVESLSGEAAEALKREKVESLNAEARQDGKNVQRSTFNAQRSIEVTMNCQVGKIYYTLDGSDPRLPGGSISTNALEYTGPVSITKQTRVTARVRSDYALWSAPAVVSSE